MEGSEMWKSLVFWVILGLAMLLMVVEVHGEITCQAALTKMIPCQPYVVGAGPATPSKPCCAAVVDLNKEASTKKIRRDLCVCFLNAAKSIKVDPGRAKQLPVACGVALGFPIDPSVDCQSIPRK